MYSWRVKCAFSSKRKAALGGFGVRIKTNSSRSLLYSRQTGVVSPSRSFVFDFQSDVRLTQVYMHTFTNNPKIIMTITKKYSWTHSSYAPNGWKSTIHWHLHKKEKHDTRTWFNFPRRLCRTAARLRKSYLTCPLIAVLVVTRLPLCALFGCKIKDQRIQAVICWIGCEDLSANCALKNEVMQMSSVWRGEGWRENSPSCLEQHTCGENKNRNLSNSKYDLRFRSEPPWKSHMITHLVLCFEKMKQARLFSPPASRRLPTDTGAPIHASPTLNNLPPSAAPFCSLSD